jgi:cell division protein FtsI/penicillin-binding protein 2
MSKISIITLTPKQFSHISSLSFRLFHKQVHTKENRNKSVNQLIKVIIKKVADRGKIVDCEISPTMGKQIDLSSLTSI